MKTASVKPRGGETLSGPVAQLLGRWRPPTCFLAGGRWISFHPNPLCQQDVEHLAPSTHLPSCRLRSGGGRSARLDQTGWHVIAAMCGMPIRVPRCWKAPYGMAAGPPWPVLPARICVAGISAACASSMPTPFSWSDHNTRTGRGIVGRARVEGTPASGKTPGPSSRTGARPGEEKKSAQAFQGYRDGASHLKDDGAPPFFAGALRFPPRKIVTPIAAGAAASRSLTRPAPSRATPPSFAR